MADEQNWDAYANQDFGAATDTLLARTAAGAGVEVGFGHVVARRVQDGPYNAEGRITGGFGADTTGGVLDFNDASNTVAGCGVSLLAGTAANAPPVGTLWHPFTFEYAGTKSGAGNVTQFAIPYYDSTGFYGFRFRFGGAWSPWRAIMYENLSGNVAPSTDNAKTLGNSSRRFSVVYAGTGTINTSDERTKRDIGAVPDEWLDAWGDVEWQRFKFKDGNRWHIGLIAQRVHAAFAARNLDAFEIGLCCYDEWESTEEPVIGEDGNPTGETKLVGEAGDLWGLRYDECFAMEAAWNRREMARAAQKHEELEAKLQALIEQAGS